jgi:hypothetical protein
LKGNPVPPIPIASRQGDRFGLQILDLKRTPVQRLETIKMETRETSQDNRYGWNIEIINAFP